MSRKTAIWFTGGSALVVYAAMIWVYLSNPEMTPCGVDPQLYWTGYSIGELRHFILEIPPELRPVYIRSLLLLDPIFIVLFGAWVFLVNRGYTPVAAGLVAAACVMIDISENLMMWVEFRVLSTIDGIEVLSCDMRVRGPLSPVAGLTVMKFGAYAVAIGLTLWNFYQRRTA